MIHELITQWAGKASIKQMCRVFGVSRSGFYAARRRRQQGADVCAHSVQAMAVFQASGRSYGSRRLSAALRVQGINVGRHRARTLMRRLHLKPRAIALE